MEIYKIKYMNRENKAARIVVFCGNKDDMYTKAFDLYYRGHDRNQIMEIFSEAELVEIKEENITPEFVKIMIHPDDNIDTVKKKLLLLRNEPEFSYREQYLYGIIERYVDTTLLYEELTHFGKQEINKDELLACLSNMEISPLFNPDIEITYDTILKLNIHPKKYRFKVPLGEKSSSNIYADPYLSTGYFNDYSITTTNKKLLMETKLIDNTLFLCLARDVLEANNNPNLIPLYYPFLEKEEITTYDELNGRKEEFIDQSKEFINTNFIRTTEIVSKYYKLSEEPTSKLHITSDGIQEISFTIDNKLDLYIPLESLFKLIHATRNIPFIKFNPGKHKEKIFRLFTNRVSKNGKKIPLLTKNKLNRLRKTIGLYKSVTLYLNEENAYEIIVTLNEDGKIGITL